MAHCLQPVQFLALSSALLTRLFRLIRQRVGARNRGKDAVAGGGKPSARCDPGEPRRAARKRYLVAVSERGPVSPRTKALMSSAHFSVDGTPNCGTFVFQVVVNAIASLALQSRETACGDSFGLSARSDRGARSSCGTAA
jgi:hypothetical protein